MASVHSGWFLVLSCFIMSILAWNARGLCKPGKRRRLKALIKNQKAMMVLIQETKKGFVN